MPEGYMENAQGHLIPRDQVREIDMARHELVMEKVAKVRAMREALARLKAELMGDVGAFVALSAEKYGAKLGGDKGNVSLTSYDGRFKIVRQVAEHITFDERLQAAKALVDECLRDWTEGARSELQALIDQAFQVDKEGRINTGRILNLRRLEITDERWQQAMRAIGDSIQVTGTKAYVRVYERTASGRYDPIPLDMAAV
ncbi:DUF3164 family protein [Desulfovibrio aminophilus]|uniref:DUF3164 family protein n=1 Tax=Desulfovibrio aminophilus TaxID=81425 RepID=UPI00041F6A1B|nr:DUF3164 family protein [Desulfovibrio aminophilus]